MLACELLLELHELCPSAAYSVFQLNVDGVFKRDFASEVFDSTIGRQDLYVHIVDNHVILATSPPGFGGVG